MYSIDGWLLLMPLMIWNFLHERKKNTTCKWEWDMEEAELPLSSVFSYLFLHEELHSPSDLKQLSLSPPMVLWIRNSARPWVGSSSASYCFTWHPPVMFLLRPSWCGGSLLVSHLCLAPWWEASPCELPESMLAKSSSKTCQLGNPQRVSCTKSTQGQDAACPYSGEGPKPALKDSHVVSLVMLDSPNPRCTLSRDSCDFMVQPHYFLLCSLVRQWQMQQITWELWWASSQKLRPLITGNWVYMKLL